MYLVYVRRCLHLLKSQHIEKYNKIKLLGLQCYQTYTDIRIMYYISGYKQLHWLPLDQLVKFHSLSSMYKYIHIVLSKMLHLSRST